MTPFTSKDIATTFMWRATLHVVLLDGRIYRLCENGQWNSVAMMSEWPH